MSTPATNPFTPSFGVSPPLLVGRDAEIATFVDALDAGPGSPGRAMLFTGARGAGKTVVLNAVEDAARQRGWVVVSETARPGIAAQLAQTVVPQLLRQHAPDTEKGTWTGANVQAFGFGAGVEREAGEAYPVVPTLRSRLDELTDVLAPRGTGVVVSLDEVHTAALDDLREVIHVVQHAFREGRPLALVAAGLPSAVEDLLNDDVMTFLRRAERRTLGRVADHHARDALRGPIRSAGRDVTEQALDVAVAGTQGYPFLVQLVGHHMWAADLAPTVIDLDQARVGVTRAAERVGHLVHAPSLTRLSAVDRDFLSAMAVDAGPSRMQDVAQRLGVSANYASQYRLRLIAAQVVTAAGYGRVDFALPYVREYVRDQL